MLSVGGGIQQEMSLLICPLFLISSLQKQQPSFTYEVIVVDDGSKDKTTEVIFCVIVYLSKINQ